MADQRPMNGTIFRLFLEVGASCRSSPVHLRSAKVAVDTVFRQALVAEGFTELLPALDAAVNCPFRAWLEDDFSGYLSGIQLPGFAEAVDCDDWSMFARAMAGYANGLSGSSAGVAFAVAKITIYPSSTFNGLPGPGTHLTNAVLLDTGEIVAYERQTQTMASFKQAVADGAIGLDWVLY
jgi:hypothetical protein